MCEDGKLIYNALHTSTGCSVWCVRACDEIGGALQSDVGDERLVHVIEDEHVLTLIGDKHVLILIEDEHVLILIDGERLLILIVDEPVLILIEDGRGGANIGRG